MDDETAELCARLYKDGWKIKDIAERVGFSKDAVRRALKKKGVWKKGKITKEMEEKIIELYTKDGLGTTRIGKIVGVTAKTVYDVLKRNGVELRKYEISDEKRKEITRLYLEGMSIAEISRKFGVGYNTVMKILDEEGVHEKKKRLSEEEKKEIARLYEEGWSLARLGEKFGLSSSGILWELEKMGVPRREQRIPEDVEEAIVNLRLSGWSIWKIVRELGVSESAARRVLRDYNITDVEVERPKKFKKIPKEIRKKIVEMYKSGARLVDISKEFNVSVGRIYWYVNCGIEDRKWSNRIHHFKEDYFREIDSCDKAYYLGLLLSDGWVSERFGVVRLDLIGKDGYIIEKFADKLGIGRDETIKRYIHKNTIGKNLREVEHYRINLTSKEMVGDLNKWGLHDRKSYDAKPPEGIPEEFLGDFWRGVFDGDGSVHIQTNNKGYNYLRIDLVGTEDVVKGFQEFLDIGGYINFVQNKLWSYQGNVGSQKKFMKVYDKLYGSECDAFLKRKRKIFEEYAKLRGWNLGR